MKSLANHRMRIPFLSISRNGNIWQKECFFLRIWFPTLKKFPTKKDINKKQYHSFTFFFIYKSVETFHRWWNLILDKWHAFKDPLHYLAAIYYSITSCLWQLRSARKNLAFRCDWNKKEPVSKSIKYTSSLIFGDSEAFIPLSCEGIGTKVRDRVMLKFLEILGDFLVKNENGVSWGSCNFIRTGKKLLFGCRETQ